MNLFMLGCALELTILFDALNMVGLANFLDYDGMFN